MTAAWQQRNALDGEALSAMPRSELRRRRRQGLDTARGQRRAIHPWRRQVRAAELAERTAS